MLNVRDFGAAGDGVTDDYEAMRAAAAALCAAPAGSRLVYPAGTYLVDRYRVFRGPVRNGVDDIVYRNCHGVAISGYGARIEVKGDFHQPADFELGGVWFSTVKQLTPFFMIDSSDFTIEGFVLDGNVGRMTRDPRSLEDASAGIMTRRCSRYLLRDLEIHHFSGDAVLIGWLDFDDDFRADRDVRIENVRGHHNGRVGLVLGHVRGAWIVRSSFNDTGRTDGAFPPFAPVAGMDIEPDFGVEDGVDVPAGEIYFIDSEFSGSKGPDFHAIFPKRVDTVVVSGSTIVSALDTESAYSFVLGTKTGVVERSTIDLRSGAGVLLGAWNEDALPLIESVVYANNLLRLSTNGSLVSEGVVPYDLIGNDVRVTATGSDGTVMNLTGLRSIVGNRFFVNSAGRTGEHRQVVIRTDGTKRVSGNVYATDFPFSGSFATSYDGTDSVDGELFPDAPAFTPAATLWNRTLPYPVATPPQSDSAAPRITNLTAVQFSSKVLISWLTDEAASSVVEVGGRIIPLEGTRRYHPVWLEGLAPGAIVYRVRSTDAFGHTTVSEERTFVVTQMGGALVTTTTASAISLTTATLRGTVNPLGTTVVTRVEYGPTAAYGTSVDGPFLTGTTTQPVSVTVPMPCGETMHYRIVADSLPGTRYGADRTFRTPPCRRRAARS